LSMLRTILLAATIGSGAYVLTKMYLKLKMETNPVNIYFMARVFKPV
jgi:hypothetical protein